MSTTQVVGHRRSHRALRGVAESLTNPFPSSFPDPSPYRGPVPRVTFRVVEGELRRGLVWDVTQEGSKFSVYSMVGPSLYPQSLLLITTFDRRWNMNVYPRNGGVSFPTDGVKNPVPSLEVPPPSSIRSRRREVSLGPRRIHLRMD